MWYKSTTVQAIKKKKKDKQANIKDWILIYMQAENIRYRSIVQLHFTDSKYCTTYNLQITTRFLFLK